MQPDITPFEQLQLAAFVFPVIALVVNFAINSVQEEDEHWLYRFLVGALGVTAIVPSLIVLGIAVLGFWFQVSVPNIFRYLLLSLVAMAFLTLGVLMHEIFRGLDSGSNQQRKLFTALSGSLGILVLFLHFFF